MVSRTKAAVSPENMFFFFLKERDLFFVIILFLYLSLAVLGLLEKAMAPHSSTLAWKIPWTEKPGGL